MEYSLYEILASFVIYSFMGWCIEVIYHAVVKGRFINRGFEIGPVCPIYGFGAISVIVFLEPFKSDWFILFIASIAFTTLLEFFAGFLLEKFFHEKWWDYSKEPYNIKGYVCPRFSLMWGVACVLTVDVIHPTVMVFLRIIPTAIGVFALAVLYVISFADLVVTLINVMHIRSELNAISEIERRLDELSISIGVNISDRTLALVDKSEDLVNELDDKQFEMKQAIEHAQWEMEDNMIKQDANRRREYQELISKLDSYTDTIKSKYKRIFTAFPNLSNLFVNDK